MKLRPNKLTYLGLSLACLAANAPSAAHTVNLPEKMRVESHGGLLVYKADDDAFWFGINGRLDLDETQVFGRRTDLQTSFPNSGNIRRAYLRFSGGIGENWEYNFTPHFLGAEVAFEDAWVNYSGFCGLSNLRFGQFTPPTSMDRAGNYGIFNDTMFLESSLPSAAFLVENKGFGVWADTEFCDQVTLSAAVYQPAINFIGSDVNLFSPSSSNYSDDRRGDWLGVSGRMTFSPIHQDCNVVHFGVLGRYQSLPALRKIDNVDIFQSPFATTPEFILRNNNRARVLVTPGIISKGFSVFEAEFMTIQGPFTLEAEAYYANVRRNRIDRFNTIFIDPTDPNDPPIEVVEHFTQRGNVKFSGWHAQVAYILTGESRGYDFATGTLHNPLPTGSCGAVEIAARYSYVSLNNKNVRGGRGRNITLGLNWFVNDNVRVSANYIHSDLRTNPLLAADPQNNGFNNAVNQPLQRRTLNIIAARIGVVF